MNPSHIVLIGMMGCGKSRFGRVLAKRLNLPFYDADQCIAKEEGKTIPEIFKEKGESYFRALETNFLNTLFTIKTPWVLSCGGGMPLREENQIILKPNSIIIYLNTPLAYLIQRLKNDTTRPLLQSDNKVEIIKSLWEKRHPIYSELAHYTLDTENKSPYQIEKYLQRVALQHAPFLMRHNKQKRQ